LGSVAHLFLATGSRRPMREMPSVIAITGRGLQGCRHARSGSRRQVLLMDSETLHEFGLLPGQIKENITTDGLPVNDLPKGGRLEVGQTVLEVTGPCEPCDRMDEIRMGMQREMLGRRGTLCRVIQGGRIQQGDQIQLYPAVPAEEKPEERK
jgi:MOSC domain-containing protein YiiM